MRIRHSRDQWAQWIEQQASSELTVKEFCNLHQIQVQSFYNWRARLAARPAEPSLHNPLFVPLTVRPSNIVEIEMRCGATLRVPSDMLVTVVQVLHQLGAKL